MAIVSRPCAHLEGIGQPLSGSGSLRPDELERLSKAGGLVDAMEQFAYVKTLTDDLLALMSETIPRPGRARPFPPGPTR